MKKGIIWSEISGWILILAVMLIILVLIAGAAGKIDISFLSRLGV